MKCVVLDGKKNGGILFLCYCVTVATAIRSLPKQVSVGGWVSIQLGKQAPICLNSRTWLKRWQKSKEVRLLLCESCSTASPWPGLAGHCGGMLLSSSTHSGGSTGKMWQLTETLPKEAERSPELKRQGVESGNQERVLQWRDPKRELQRSAEGSPGVSWWVLISTWMWGNYQRPRKEPPERTGGNHLWRLYKYTAWARKRKMPSVFPSPSLYSSSCLLLGWCFSTLAGYRNQLGSFKKCSCLESVT